MITTKVTATPNALQGFEKACGREAKAPETPVPKEFLSYEELMLPRPEPRPEGEHLSDYEPSEVGAEEAPAIPALHRYQKPSALVLFEIVSHSRSRLTNGWPIFLGLFFGGSFFFFLVFFVFLLFLGFS